jgi:hypothetical protein
LALVLALAVAALLVLVRLSRLTTLSEGAPPEVPSRGGQATLVGLIALHDVDYGLPGRSHPDQRLDFYQLPAALRGPAPVVILLHGGGFHSGDEEIDIEEPLYQDWLARGWSIASVRYRLAPRTCGELADASYPHRSFYPEPEHDASLAVQFLRAQAEAWSLDPEKLVLRGESAGGGLATLVGLADERAFLDDRHGHGGRPTRVRAIVNLGGPTDATYPNANGPENLVHVGYFVDCRVSQPLPSMQLLLELSSYWVAPRSPQNALNQQVAVRHDFAGPLGGNLHDPFYGQALHDALGDPRVANPSSFLDWDQGLAAPTGLDPEITESDWIELQISSLPFGAGTPGTLPRPPWRSSASAPARPCSSPTASPARP